MEGITEDGEGEKTRWSHRLLLDLLFMWPLDVAVLCLSEITLVYVLVWPVLEVKWKASLLEMNPRIRQSIESSGGRTFSYSTQFIFFPYQSPRRHREDARQVSFSHLHSDGDASVTRKTQGITEALRGIFIRWGAGGREPRQPQDWTNFQST